MSRRTEKLPDLFKEGSSLLVDERELNKQAKERRQLLKEMGTRDTSTSGSDQASNLVPGISGIQPTGSSNEIGHATHQKALDDMKKAEDKVKALEAQLNAIKQRAKAEIDAKEQALRDKEAELQRILQQQAVVAQPQTAQPNQQQLGIDYAAMGAAIAMALHQNASAPVQPPADNPAILKIHWETEWRIVSEATEELETATDEQDKEAIIIRLETGPTLMRSFKEIHSKAMARLDLDDVTDCAGKAVDLQGRFDLARIKALRVKTLLDNQNAITRSGKLPEIKYQTFTGKPTEWSNFWDSFRIGVHDRKDLSTVAKFQYLQSWVGGDAKNAIKGYDYSEANYDLAIQSLTERFGKPEIIIEAHKAALRNIPTTTASFHDLKKLLDLVEYHRRCAEKLGVARTDYESTLQSELLTKIPKPIIFRWKERWPVPRPPVDIILKSLRHEVDTLEDMHRTEHPNDTSTPQAHVLFTPYQSAHVPVEDSMPPNKATQPKEEKEDRGKGRQRKGCVFCRGRHSSHNCKVDTAAKRKAKAIELHLCFRCLNSGHITPKCTSKYACLNCKKEGHSTALCNQSSKPAAGASKDALSGFTGIDHSKDSLALAVASDNKILLPTFTALVKGRDGLHHRALGLVDTGSHRSFIRSGFAQQLGWGPTGEEEMYIHSFGVRATDPTKYQTYKIVVESTSKDLKEKVHLQVLSQTTISHMSLYEPTEYAYQLIKEKKILADDRIHTGQTFDGIDILVGCDQYWSLMHRKAPGSGPHGLASVSSRIGWTIHGSYTDLGSGQHVLASTAVETTQDELWNDLEMDHREFWKVEHIGILETEESSPDFQTRYEDFITRQADGRYTAQLPWKEFWTKLKDNRAVSEARLSGLMTRLRKHEEELQVYHQQFEEYRKLGFIAKADPDYKGVKFITPHRPVIRKDATSTKCRPVFDGSSHHKGSPSLNNVLEVGPNLNPELLACHLRFRLFKYAWTADIAKAFLQIRLHEGDSEAIRFLWYEDPTKPETLTEYKWTRVPFGLTCSPFILRAVILKHLKLYEDRFPETVAQLRLQLYVDDWLGGADTLEEAVQRIKEAQIIFDDAKMELTKWTTNSSELEAALPEIKFHKTPTVIGTSSLSTDTAKALGVYWNQESDQFVFQPQALVEQAAQMGKQPTKRQVFSLALRLFDPLGLLSPVILVAKMIMQKLWETGIKWDDRIPLNIAEEWRVFLEGLQGLDKVRVDRWLKTDKTKPIELHVFCDASEDAYSAVAYVRQEGDVTTSRILCSKTRVAPTPKKSMSIPRLELLSNLLAAKIATYAIKAFEPRTTDASAWTDSMIALCWIQGESGRWKTFVHNRVEKIKQVFPPNKIRHCPGLQNPADLASRGTSTSNLLRTNCWWYGPEWLVRKKKFWPPLQVLKANMEKEALKEAAKNEFAIMLRPVKPPYKFEERFSEYNRLVRIVAWIKRYFCRLKKKPIPSWRSGKGNQKLTAGLKKPKLVAALTQEELRDAKLACIGIAQRDAWPNEWSSLRLGKTMPKHSVIDLLRPVWDKTDNVIRGTGRTEEAYDGSKLPIMLPPYHHITSLIIWQAHKDRMHAGVNYINSYLRKTYWVVKAHQRIKFIIGRCIKCKLVNSRNFNAPVTVLPKDRVTQRRAFDVCGVDFAGPFEVYEHELTDVKKPPPVLKAHACIITCAATRAIHIEPMPDQNGTSFIFALRRFISFRGIPAKFYSDNSKTFNYAHRMLKYLHKEKRVCDYLATNGIEWTFSPSLAPWWGGFWERMVKTMKNHINTTVGVLYLDYQQFDTILKETAFLMNNRPITRFNHEDGRTLTPFQLISAEDGCDNEFRGVDGLKPIAHKDDSAPSELREREMKRQLRLADWWEEWQKDYLAEVRKFHYGPRRNVKAPGVGHVVLVHDQVRPRMKWVTARVKEILPSRDDAARQVVLVNSKQETITRPVSCLYPLETHAGTIDLQPDDVGQLPKEPWRKRFDALERRRAKARRTLEQKNLSSIDEE